MFKHQIHLFIPIRLLILPIHILLLSPFLLDVVEPISSPDLVSNLNLPILDFKQILLCIPFLTIKHPEQAIPLPGDPYEPPGPEHSDDESHTSVSSVHFDPSIPPPVPPSSSSSTSSVSTPSLSPIPPPPAPRPPSAPMVLPQAPRAPRRFPAPLAPLTRYNESARSEAKMLRVASIVAKEARQALDNKAFQHLRALATTAPSTTKFILPDPKSDDEILIRTQTISNSLVNLLRHLHKYDMFDCFHLVMPLQMAPYGDLLGPQLLLNQFHQPVILDIIHNYANIEESQVLASITFLRKYGQYFDLQNLDWSHELLINCCDAILSSKIKERLSGYTIKTQGAPLFLYLMLQLIISTPEEASKPLLTRLDNLKIHQVEGENVLNIVSLVRKAVYSLTLVHKLPDDIVDKLFDIFQTSSIKEFNSMFSAMKIQRRIDQRTLHVGRFTPEVIFETAPNFRRLTSGLVLVRIKLHFLFAMHYAGKCPNKNKTKNNYSKNNKRNNSNASPPNNQQQYNQDDPIFSTPPRDGCKVKSINDRDHFWCHHHKRWNQKHNTRSCPGPKRNARNGDRNKTPQANVAAKAAPTNSTASTASTAQPTASTAEPSSTGISGVQFCMPTPDAVSTLSDPSTQHVMSADPSINYANMVPSMPRFDAYGRRLWRLLGHQFFTDLGHLLLFYYIFVLPSLLDPFASLPSIFTSFSIFTLYLVRFFPFRPHLEISLFPSPPVTLIHVSLQFANLIHTGGENVVIIN